MGPSALDYPAVFQVAGVLGVSVDETMLRKIQAVEAEQLRLWSRARKDKER